MSSFQIFNNCPFPSPIAITSENPLEVTNETNGNLYIASRDNVLLNTINPYNSSAFGETNVAKLSPVIQLQFPYSINTNNVIQFNNGSGTITNGNSQANLISGTTQLSDAAIASQDFITYQPGMGAMARFTSGFTTGNSSIGTFQQIGLGNQEDGFFFSYTNNDINILIRKGGLRTQYSLVITTGATSNGNIILTLNGNSQNIPVTISDINNNASEIGNFDFPLYNNSSNGNTVNIIAERTGSQSGAFTFNANGTGMIATLTQKVVGVTETITSIPRSNWNKDKCDGTDFLPLIDWSKGNVFQIKYQWLGYGFVSFYLENPNTGNLTLVHEYKYPNTSTTPSISNPSLQFLANVANALTTNNVSMFVGSVGCFIEGDYPSVGGTFGNNVSRSYSATIGDTNLDNIVTFRSPPYFNGISNRAVVGLLRFTITVNKACNINIIRNATLSGNTVWNPLGNNILLESSQSSSVATGGEILYTDRGEKQDRFTVDPVKINFYIVKIYPSDTVTFCGISDNNNANVSVVFNWLEPL
jgi:hypothetical protein